jgi:hypothetical protein
MLPIKLLLFVPRGIPEASSRSIEPHARIPSDIRGNTYTKFFIKTGTNNR